MSDTNKDTDPNDSGIMIHCQHCGTANDVGNAACANCQRPFTAYAGQIGQAENYEGKLAGQVAALDTRPPGVRALSVLCVLYAVVGPLCGIIAAWSRRTRVNADGTNAVQAAAGIVVPIFQTVLLLPAAIALCVVAYFAWTQRPWAWTAGAVALAAIALLSLILDGLTFTAFYWSALAGAVAWKWCQYPVKAWFALD